MERKFTKEMVDDYADKLLIGLTPEENKMVLDEFDIIDEQINIINDIPGIEKVEPMTFPFPLEGATLREDEVGNYLTVGEVLDNAKEEVDDQVKVPKVVDEDV